MTLHITHQSIPKFEKIEFIPERNKEVTLFIIRYDSFHLNYTSQWNEHSHEFYHTFSWIDMLHAKNNSTKRAHRLRTNEVPVNGFNENEMTLLGDYWQWRLYGDQWTSIANWPLFDILLVHFVFKNKSNNVVNYQESHGKDLSAERLIYFEMFLGSFLQGVKKSYTSNTFFVFYQNRK